MTVGLRFECYGQATVDHIYDPSDPPHIRAVFAGDQCSDRFTSRAAHPWFYCGWILVGRTL